MFSPDHTTQVFDFGVLQLLVFFIISEFVLLEFLPLTLNFLTDFGCTFHHLLELSTLVIAEDGHFFCFVFYGICHFPDPLRFFEHDFHQFGVQDLRRNILVDGFFVVLVDDVL